MGHLAYLAVLAGCLGAALWLEPVLRVNVLRRWRRLLLTLVPVVVIFALWDLAAIAAGHWTFDPEQTTGVLLPGGLPVDEVLFFVTVPVCAILGFEAVRAVRRWPVGDESETPSDAESPPADKPAPGAGPAPATGSARGDSASAARTTRSGGPPAPGRREQAGP